MGIRAKEGEEKRKGEERGEKLKDVSHGSPRCVCRVEGGYTCSIRCYTCTDTQVLSGVRIHFGLVASLSW